MARNDSYEPVARSNRIAHTVDVTEETPLTPEQRRERALQRRQVREQPVEPDEPVEEAQSEPAAFSYGPGPSQPVPVSRRATHLPGDPTAGTFEAADQWYPGMPEPQKPRRSKRWLWGALLVFLFAGPIRQAFADNGLGIWFLIVVILGYLLWYGSRSTYAQTEFGDKIPRHLPLYLLGAGIVLALVTTSFTAPWGLFHKDAVDQQQNQNEANDGTSTDEPTDAATTEATDDSTDTDGYDVASTDNLSPGLCTHGTVNTHLYDGSSVAHITSDDCTDSHTGELAAILQGASDDPDGDCTAAIKPIADNSGLSSVDYQVGTLSSGDGSQLFCFAVTTLTTQGTRRVWAGSALAVN